MKEIIQRDQDGKYINKRQATYAVMKNVQEIFNIGDSLMKNEDFIYLLYNANPYAMGIKTTEYDDVQKKVILENYDMLKRVLDEYHANSIRVTLLDNLMKYGEKRNTIITYKKNKFKADNRLKTINEKSTGSTDEDENAN